MRKQPPVWDTKKGKGSGGAVASVFENNGKTRIFEGEVKELMILSKTLSPSRFSLSFQKNVFE